MGHEIGYHTMEERAIVVSLIGQEDEIVDSPRGFIGVQFDLDVALVSLHGCQIGRFGFDDHIWCAGPLLRLVGHVKSFQRMSFEGGWLQSVQ